MLCVPHARGGHGSNSTRNLRGEPFFEGEAVSRAATRTLHLNILGFYDVESPNVSFDPAIDGVLSVWANEFEAFHCHLLRLGSWANGDAASTAVH